MQRESDIDSDGSSDARPDRFSAGAAHLNPGAKPLLAVIAIIAAFGSAGCPGASETTVDSAPPQTPPSTAMSTQPKPTAEPAATMTKAEMDEKAAAEQAAEKKRLAEESRLRKKRIADEALAAKELADERKSEEEARAAIAKLPAAERDKKLKAFEEQKKKEEWNVNGLVLKLKSVNLGRNEITGDVVNRTGRRLGHAEITFELLDADRGSIGFASTSIDNFLPNTKWKFHIDTIGREVFNAKPKSLTYF